MGYRKTSFVVEEAGRGHSPSPDWRIQTSVATAPSSASSPSSSTTSSSSDTNANTNTNSNTINREENGIEIVSRKLKLIDVSAGVGVGVGADLPHLSWSDDDDDDTDSSGLLTRKTKRSNARTSADPQSQQWMSPATLHTLGRRNRIRSRHVSVLSSSSSSSMSSKSSSTMQNSLSSSSSSSSSSSGSEDTDYQIKNTNDALVGSMLAAINFCRHSGVPKPSIVQLERNLEMKRYFAVLSRIQSYIGCIKSENREEAMTKIHLVATAWEALCRCKALEYKLAYKSVARLRNTKTGMDDPSSTTLLSSFSLSSSHSSSAASSLPRASAGIIGESEIQRAIQLQINLAEQVTACRKKLYLVHQWQRQMLSRTNKPLDKVEP